MAISSLVIHTTEGNWKSDIQWLCNPNSGVSCHYVIAPDGTIYRIVDDSKRAWHAGDSSYAGKSDYNSFSIGIEISHQQNKPYGAAQYPALTELCAHLIETYATIQRPYVVTHRQIAIPAGRKIDPTNVSDAEFAEWADSLFAPPPPPPVAYRVAGLPVYERSDHTGPLWGYLSPGQTVTIDDPSNGHVASLNGVPAGIGFVDMAGLMPL